MEKGERIFLKINDAKYSEEILHFTRTLRRKRKILTRANNANFVCERERKKKAIKEEKSNKKGVNTYSNIVQTRQNLVNNSIKYANTPFLPLRSNGEKGNKRKTRENRAADYFPLYGTPDTIHEAGGALFK
jgi:hypothetical protein